MRIVNHSFDKRCTWIVQTSTNTKIQARQVISIDSQGCKASSIACVSLEFVVWSIGFGSTTKSDIHSSACQIVDRVLLTGAVD